MNDPTVTGQFAVGGIVIGIAAILGLWALVQGIIAIVTKRGRGWGVFAVILAVVATIATFATYIGVAAAAAVGGGN
jgi:predicted permease